MGEVKKYKQSKVKGYNGLKKSFGDFNPISAGVLENQDMLGGEGEFNPPPL